MSEAPTLNAGVLGSGALFTFHNNNDLTVLRATSTPILGSPGAVAVGSTSLVLEPSGEAKAKQVHCQALTRAIRNIVFNNQQRLDEVFPGGTTTERAFQDGFSNLVDTSSRLRTDSRVLWTGLCGPLLSGYLAKDALNIALPSKSSDKYEGRASFLWMSQRYVEGNGVDHDMIHDALLMLVEAWDLLNGLDGAPAGTVRYYRAAMYPILILFDPKALQNVFAMFPVFMAGMDN